jgi:hypothetical protein
MYATYTDLSGFLHAADPRFTLMQHFVKIRVLISAYLVEAQ